MKVGPKSSPRPFLHRALQLLKAINVTLPSSRIHTIILVVEALLFGLFVIAMMCDQVGLQRNLDDCRFPKILSA